MKIGESSFRTILFGIVGVALICGYWQMLSVHLPIAFREPAEDLSYAWYVPLFSIYVLWRERREIAESIGAPSPWGLFLAVPFLLVGLLGSRGLQIRFELVGFVGLLISVTWAFFGSRTMRRTLFPFLFLLFCMPLHSFLDIVTIHLRMLAVSVASGTLRGLGVDVVREGTMLASSTGAFSIDVADPCSGLRSLFAMTALTAGYAYFTQPTWIRRGLLFACSIPIAVFGNVTRILSIVLVAAACSSDFATGFYHDYSGYVVFLVSILLMVTAGELVSKGVKR